MTTQEKITAGIFPQRVEIELVSSCNLHCVYCPGRYLDDRSGLMEYNLFLKIIDEVAAFPDTVIVLHRRGESLLHPRFIDICEKVQGKFKEVQIATNATLLDDKKSEAIIGAIDFISFSIDTPEMFNKTRTPANYEEVERNILNFLSMNHGRVKTQVSMVKSKLTSFQEIERFKQLWEGKVDRIRVYEEHSTDGNFGSLKKKRTDRLPCVMPFYDFLIYFDGQTGRCNHDWNGPSLGNVKKDSIETIWNNADYSALRKQHETLLITDSVCKNCDSWYAEKGKQGTGETISDED
ncbi:MAG: radical SAM protein [Nitrospinae bacterium]|nr:radical SAM protein [Nitrospinota bacterium]